MENLGKIKDKIKKLFALSKSSNANEAAVALEMAQKLMIEHGIKRNEVGEYEVIQEKIKSNGGERPPKYEAYLVSEIGTAFGCRCAYGIKKSESNTYYYAHTFVGLDYRVQIACFIADVLLRKMKKARTDYLKKLTKVRKRINKIKRADEFCFGWAITVAEKLYQFANSNKEQEAIDVFVATLNWGDAIKTIDRDAVKKSDFNDYLNGRKEGAGVQIQHGIEGQKSGAFLLVAARK